MRRDVQHISLARNFQSDASTPAKSVTSAENIEVKKNYTQEDIES